MKRICLLLTSFMLLLSLTAFAQNNVEVRLNSGGNAIDDNKVAIGYNNVVEFWYTNNYAQITGMTQGYEFTTNTGETITFLANGNKPSAPPTKYLTVEAAYLGAFNLPDWSVDATQINAALNRVLVGGGALGGGLPLIAAPTRVYSFTFDATAWAVPTPPNDQFCVDNIFFPPAGGWEWASANPPTNPNFQGNPDDGSGNAPAACFVVFEIPCLPPTFTATPGGPVNRNHCLTYTFNFDATEGGNTPAANPVVFSTSAGTINASTGELSVTPISTCGTTDVTVTATNACGSAVDYNFTITWTNNNPVITNCAGAQALKVGKGNPIAYDFNSTDADPCDAAVWSIVANDAVVNAPSISGTGLFSWVTTNADVGIHSFTATVTDPCGGQASCTFQVEVLATEPFVIKIEKTHNTIQGNFEYVSILKMAGSEKMGGFDFLIAYDASAISFFSAELGAALGPAGCGWEYFTYRYGAVGNCGGPCPSGMLRVVAIADVNNGANHPDCFDVAPGSELVSLKFYVTNDRTFECMYIPIRFAWLDCGDNGISNIGGDTLWISDQVFDFENTNPLLDPNYNITDMSCYFAIAYGGACAACDVSEKYEPVRFILFWNGGIDIVCADSIDARGDVNLNGIAYEIADAVLYTNYFLYGLSALDPNPQFREAQIAASDANADGIPLSVGDLVFLLRVIVGDELPFPKLSPFANNATVSFDGSFSTQSTVELGGVYATFRVNGAYSINSTTSMKVESAESDGLVKVLVFAGIDNMTNRLEAGSNNLFTINGNAELVDVQVADYNGNLLNTRVNKNVLPTEFALQQNVPNPFNPATKIGLDLPTVSDWKIDIYNVAGQLVQSFNGRGVGNVSVDWDATNVASGIYFYKATAGAFTATKKMVLMK